MNRIGAWAIVGAAFGFARQMKRWTVGPSITMDSQFSSVSISPLAAIEHCLRPSHPLYGDARQVYLCPPSHQSAGVGPTI